MKPIHRSSDLLFLKKKHGNGKGFRFGFGFLLGRSIAASDGSSGCLVCCSKPKLISSAGAIPERQETEGQFIKKPGKLEELWSTSAFDMDNSTIQSQGSISSISTSNQTLDPQGGGPARTDFVNHGLLLWNQTRQQWLGSRKNETRTQQVREPKLSLNVTYESLLGSNKPFPQPVPLSEMVDFLVDVWEQEGMYD